MKWAKLTTDPDLNGLDDKDIQKSFEQYNNIVEAANGTKRRGTLKNKKNNKEDEDFVEWVTHPLGQNMGMRAREDYELFCGGWLEFYDRIVRELKTEHVMHFEWNKEGKSVTIWITPEESPGPKTYTLSLPALTDPPTPPAPPPPPKSS